MASLEYFRAAQLILLRTVSTQKFLLGDLYRTVRATLQTRVASFPRVTEICANFVPCNNFVYKTLQIPWLSMLGKHIGFNILLPLTCAVRTKLAKNARNISLIFRQSSLQKGCGLV